MTQTLRTSLRLLSKTAVAFAVSAVFPLIAAATVLPPGFIETEVPRPDGAATWNEAVGVTFSESGHMYVWERTGKVWIVDEAHPVTTPLLDISPEVLASRDHGMLGFALNPNFEQNGYLYVMYAVDPYHLARCDSPRNGTPVCDASYNPATTWFPSDPGTPGFKKATIGRIVRYQAVLPAGETSYAHATSINPASRRVLLGETTRTGQWNTGIPILFESHGVGSLVFGTDGTLLVSAGDGASFTTADIGSAVETYYVNGLSTGIIAAKENVGALRAQMVDSLSGKILRLDPSTGDGVVGNPYYDGGAPRAARSRVWARGLRNPYRFTLRPDTGSHNRDDGAPGTLIIGDVGWRIAEDINVSRVGGENFGWPLFEGMDSRSEYQVALKANSDAPNPLFNVAGCTQQFFNFQDLIKQDSLTNLLFPNPCNIGQLVPNAAYPSLHARPVIDYQHGLAIAQFSAYDLAGNAVSPSIGSFAPDGTTVTGTPFMGNASTGGTWFRGMGFPAQYTNTYFHGDYGGQWIKNLSFDASEQPTAVRGFLDSAGGVVAMGSHPAQEGLYYIAWTAFVRKVTYQPGNRAPIARAAANPSAGPSPLVVSFSSAGSSDPDGNPITYRWDFGDNTSSTSANPIKTYNVAGSGTVNFDATLTVTDSLGLKGQSTLLVSVNNRAPTVSITSPNDGSTYSMTGPTTVQLTANIQDSQSPLSQLSCQWQTVLYHNNHEHSDPFISSCSASATITPIGCDGESYSYGFRLRVADPFGLQAADEVRMYPACGVAGTDGLPPSRPTSVSAVATGTTQVNVTWNASTDDGGGIVAGYRVYRDGVSVGTSTNVGYLDTGLVSGRQYSYTVSAYDNANPVNQSQPSSPPAVVTTQVNTPWTGRNIGAVAATGSHAFGGGGEVITIVASGADIWNKADEFYFLSQSLTGDGELTARVSSVGNTDPWAKSGVMIRESTAAGSRHAMMMISATSGAAFQNRTTTNGASGPASTPGAPASAPLWVRIKRVGNTFTGFYSDDGVVWTQRGSITIAMNASTQIGLASTSHNDGVLMTAVFDSITLTKGTPTGDTTPPSVPTGLTATVTGTTQVSLAWNASTDTGGTVAGYRVYRNGLLAGTVTGLSFNDTGLVPGQSYAYTVVAFDNAVPSNSSAASTAANVTLPGNAPWTGGNIGAVAAAGSHTESGGTYTINASGADIWGKADEFYFVSQPLNGDGEITARVVSIGNTDPWAKAGVMIRETTAVGSRHAMMMIAATSGAAFQYRTTTNGVSGPASTPGAPVSAPQWVKLKRVGNTFTGFYSADGVTWTQRGSITIAMSAATRIGLATTSHNDGVLTQAVIDNVTLSTAPPAVDTTPPSVPTGLTATATSSTQVNLAWSASTDAGGGSVAGYRVYRNGNATPVATVTGTSYSNAGLAPSTTYSYTVAAFDNASPANVSAASAAATATTLTAPPASPLVGGDIGAVAVAGSHIYSGGVYTVNASGADIWGTKDEFYFLSQSLNGDGQITARVVSVGNTDPWAKAGVMIRETTAVGSRHAMMVVSPVNGAIMQYRTATNGVSGPSGASGTAVTLPQWVRINRQGNTFRGYHSADGVAWTLRLTYTVTMNSSVRIGLATTSHNDGTLTQAVFDNVTVVSGSAPDTVAPTTPSGVQAAGAGVAAYGAPTAYAAGLKTHSAHLRDLDGDGHVDLMAANAGSNSVSVFMGNANGTFDAGVSYAVGVYPKVAVTGKFNADAHWDIVTADQDGNTVSVLLGNGNGTFQPASTIPSCNANHDIAVADFNGDGKSDFAVACHRVPWVTNVFIGNGDGTFLPPTAIVAGNEPHSVAAHDFNVDGNVDLVIASRTSNYLSVHLGNGNGTFQAGTTYTTAAGPHSVRAGDLDGDGDLDLVSANDTAGSISVLRGNGNGTFGTRTDYATLQLSKHITLADTDNDGDLDVVTTNVDYPTCCTTNGAKISVFPNRGDGTLLARADFNTGRGPFATAVHDLDGDGVKDIVSGNWHDGSVTVLKGQLTSRVTLSWTASTDAGTGVSGYRIYRNGGATPLATTTTPAYTDTTVTSGAAYVYQIAAFDGATPANVSPLSTPANVTAP